MKKIIAICMMMALALFVIEAPLQAQKKTVKSPASSAKKKTASSSSSKGTLSVTAFLKKESWSSGFATFKSDSQIESALKNAGFTCTSKTSVRKEIVFGSDDEDFEPGKVTNFVYSKNGVKVEWQSYSSDSYPNDSYKDAISITFSNSTAKNAFISSLKANGYHNENGEYWNHDRIIYASIEGNKIILIGNWA